MFRNSYLNAVLLGKKKKKPKCQTIGTLLNKFQSNHTIKYYFATKICVVNTF